MTRRLCLVTGASSGIGAALARLYAAQGYDLALAARRADRLEALAAELRATGVEVLVIPADLSLPETPERLLSAVAEQGRHVDALVNNAGYGLPGAYVSTSWAAQAAFLQLMLVSVCELTHRALPGMVDRRFGRIINVASLAGLVPGSRGHTLYAGTKSFLIKFSQSLNLENREAGVHVTALCPGLTYSEFHDANGTRERVTAGTPKWMWQDADTVARAGWDAVEAGKPITVPGLHNKAIAGLAKALPDGQALALMSRTSRRVRQP